MAQIRVDREGSIEKAIRKFKTICKKEGIIDEVKKRSVYEKPSSRKHRKNRKSSKKRSQQ